MGNELQVFSSNIFGRLRVVEVNGETLFIAKDVCDILDIKNSREAVGRLDLDEKGVVLTDTPGGKQNVNAVTEQGLYNLVLSSRKPSARDFRRWVVHEVLPAIRKHGGYLTPDKLQEVLQDPDTLIQLLQNLKAEQEKRAAAEKTIADNAPKVLFANSVITSEKAILIGELAKIIKQNGVEIGQKRLFKHLREHGYLCKFGESYNLPTQKAMELALFEIKKTSIIKGNGDTIIRNTVKVTPKGQIYFINKFLKKEVAV